MRRSLDSYLRLWLILTLIGLPLTIALAFLTHRFLPTPSRYGDVGSIFQGTLGLVVSLAGALVAILIASNANRMISNERLQDSLESVSDRVDEGINPILNLVRLLEHLYGSFIFLDQYYRSPLIKELSHKPSWKDDVDAPLTEDQQHRARHYKSEIGKSFLDIANAMESIASNVYSSVLWRRQPQRGKQQLSRLMNAHTVGSVDIYGGLSDYAQLIRLRGRMLIEQSALANVSDIVVSRLLASITKDSHGDDFDHVATRTLVELGGELWCNPSESGIANYGFAALLDLILAVPTPKEVLMVMEEIYSPMVGTGVVGKIPFAQIANHQRTFFGSALQDTVDFVLANRIRLGVPTGSE